MMVIKIMTRVICNKIIIMGNIQQWNSMTGISKSNKRPMQDKSMTRDNIIKNNTMAISIISKTKDTIN